MAVPVGAAMELETFITAVFCMADDFVRDLTRAGRLRRRGPEPMLADSEVLTIEAVGEFLGLDTDQALHAYFRRHFAAAFPGLRCVHRTTFARQAANLWLVKIAFWRHVAAATRHDGALALIDSLPVPVCRFARAFRCRSFRGVAAFGRDPLAHQTYYGLRLHLRVAWPGVITAMAGLAQPGDCHGPAERLLDPLPDALAEGIPCRPRRRCPTRRGRSAPRRCPSSLSSQRYRA